MGLCQQPQPKVLQCGRGGPARWLAQIVATVDHHGLRHRNGNATGRQVFFHQAVLGDRDGTTCAPEFIHLIGDTLRGFGYSVACNEPYKGVELIGRIGQLLGVVAGYVLAQRTV